MPIGGDDEADRIDCLEERINVVVGLTTAFRCDGSGFVLIQVGHTHQLHVGYLGVVERMVTAQVSYAHDADFEFVQCRLLFRLSGLKRFNVIHPLMRINRFFGGKRTSRHTTGTMRRD